MRKLALLAASGLLVVAVAILVGLGTRGEKATEGLPSGTGKAPGVFVFPPEAREPSGGPPAPEGASPATVSTGSLTLPTFKTEDLAYTPPPFALDDVGPGYPYERADRSALRWDDKRAEDRVWKTVVLENEYLKVTLLPQLGGRLFEAIYKPTGKQVFYRAQRLTPYELWNCGKEWMFATGGLRFEFPTWGHDPDTEEPWEPELHRWPNGSAAVTFTRTDVRTGLTGAVRVSLDPGRSWIRLNVALSNPTGRRGEGGFWIITGLMGTRGIEFIMPTEFAIDHGGERTYRWPVADGVDWTYFRNWPRMQAFFALDWNSTFSGLYDHQAGSGVVRCADPKDTPGLKLWGAPDQMDRYYISLYGGLCQTMEERLTLAPGEVKSWEEVWYPLVETGGLTEATREVAVSLHTDDGNLVMGILPTCKQVAAHVLLSRGDTVLLDRKTDFTPAGALVERVPVAGEAETLTLRITAADGRLLLEKTLKVNDIRPVFDGKR